MTSSVTGIISEYNPFHNGHKYLIGKRRQHAPDTHFIAVMSGNFTQRGEASILNKWQRAALAVQNGIDLVLELPVIYAVNSAEYFAYGGIKLLHDLNCVDTICFGSEYTDEIKIKQIAKLSTSNAFSNLLKLYLNSGLSYAAATSKSLHELTGMDENIFKAPNTILGTEYVKASLKLHADFKFDIIKRTKAAHHDLHYQESFASGTAVRHALYQNDINFTSLKQVVPIETFTLIKNLADKFSSLNLPSRKIFPDEEYLSLPLLTKLRLAKLNDISSIYGISEGLEYKLLEACTQSTSHAFLLQLMKNKRYPLTRLQRLLLYILLDIKKSQMEQFKHITYARVLAFNQRGTHLLRKIKKCSPIPIITKTTAFLDSKKRRQDELTTLNEMIALDTYATELYNLCFDPIKPYGMDFTTTPFFYKQN